MGAPAPLTQRLRRHARAGGVATLAGALLLVAAALWVAIDGRMLAEYRISTAAARWERAGLTDYRMVTEVRVDNGNYCRQEIEVRRGGVIRPLEDSCGGRLLTAPQLFGELRNVSLAEPVCGLIDCTCVGRLLTEVSYDAELGFPTRIRQQWVWQLNWLTLDVWRTIAAERQLPPCTFADDPDSGVTAEVIVTPLP